jgi:hypothetical protein
MILQKTYPSDLSDDEWLILKPLIPVYKVERYRKVNIREVINGLLYIVTINIGHQKELGLKFSEGIGILLYTYV